MDQVTIWRIVVYINIMAGHGYAQTEDGIFDNKIETTQESSPFYEPELCLTETFTDNNVTNKTQCNVDPDTSSQSTSVDIDFNQLPEYRVYDFVNKYFVLFTSIPGIFTNPLVIYISLTIKPYTTSELHMLFLGTTDLFVVMIRLLIYSLQTFKVPLTDQLCRAFLFVANLVYVFSNWILVCWTIERFIAVVFPIKLNAWCTVPVMKRVLLVCLTLCSITFIPQIFFSYRSPLTHYVCIYHPEYYTIYAHIESTVYMYAPMTIIIVCNTVIILRVKHAMKQRSEFTSNKTILEKRLKEQRQMTRVLVTVSVVFVLLHSTQILAKVWQAIYPDVMLIKPYSIRDFVRFYLFVILGYQVTDFQNSVNFFLYCAFGSKVRMVLKNTFRLNSKKHEKSQTNVESVTSVTAM